MLLPEADAIDTVKIPTVGSGSSRSPKHRSGSKAASSTAKRRSVLSSLSPTELLAKIDALDWDETVSADTTVLADGSEKRTQYPDHSTSNWRVAAIVATLVAVLAVLYVVLTPDPASQPVVVAQSKVEPEPAPIPIPAPIETPKIEEPPPLTISEPVVVETPQVVAPEPTAGDVAKKAQRKAERQRKAREEELARQDQLERDRRQQQEEAKQRADREAAEAARVAKAREQAAAPKAPSSPQELCAREGNFFARGLCESRTCGKAEWRNHPFCVKRIEDQLRTIGPGA
jgi:hypothetical protein